MKPNLGRILIAIGMCLLIMLFAWEAMSDEPHIFEVRRNIPLADTDQVFRDFYINAGTEIGLKPNQVITAVRKLSMRDASGTQAFGELVIPVGQLKIIFVQDRISVAREHKLLGRDDLPMLEQMSIMTGDLIETKGSFMDFHKPAKKSVQQPATEPTRTEASTEPITPIATVAAVAPPSSSVPAAPERSGAASTEKPAEKIELPIAKPTEKPEIVADGKI